jgi:hypothetical protein
LQVEDLLLFAWILLVDQVSQRFFPDELQRLVLEGRAPVWLLVAVGVPFAIVFLTRGPDDRDGHEATSRRCVISIVPLLAARDYMTGGSAWGGWLAVWFVVAIVALAPFNERNIDRVPRTGLLLRRLLVTPAMLVGNLLFSAHASTWLFSGDALAKVPEGYRGIAPLILAAFLFLYSVVGPRVMAGGPWNALAWVLRLVLYVTALKLGGRLSVVL